MLHRSKKCSDILKVASVGRGEIATFKMSLHFLDLWSIGQKAFLSDFEQMVYYLNYRPECPEVADFCYFSLTHSKYP